MNKKEALEMTIILWDYLAEYPKMTKYTAINALNLPNKMISNCPLCEYTQSFTGYLNCEYCPVDWPTTYFSTAYYCENSIYGKWVDEWNNHTLKETSKYAKQIADLARTTLQKRRKHDST